MSSAATNAGERVTADQCADCGQFWSADEVIDAYDCSGCGQRLDERRCSDCNRFAAKATTTGCPEDFADCDEIEAVIDHDGALIDPADYEPGGDAAAVREAAARAEKVAAAQALRDQAAAALTGAATTSRWADVKVGQHIVYADRFGTRSVPVIHRVDTGTHAVAVIDHYRAEPLFHGPDDTVLVDTSVPDSQTRFGITTWGPGRSDNWPSAGGDMISVDVGTHVDWRVPCLWLTLTSQWGGTIHTLGCWVDPSHATAALDLFDDAAQRLADTLHTELAPTADAVRVVSDRWVSANLPAYTTLNLVTVPRLDSAVIEFRTEGVDRRSAHLLTMDDPHLLAAGVAAARPFVGSLTWTPVVEVTDEG